MPRQGLDRAAVLAAATAMADRDGFDAVTLAALAAELNIKSPSLYKHVDGLPDIRRELALRAFAEASARIATATARLSGDAALFAMAEAVFAFGREHPGLYAATIVAPGDAEVAAAGSGLVDAVSSVLRGYGLSGEELIHAVRGVRAMVHGFLALEAMGGFRLPTKLQESYRHLVATYAAGLRAQLAGAA